jgi:uncharacterized protein YbjT (DUF2867 family)
MLVGATGLVGGFVLRQALADERIARVVAPTRRALAPHGKLENPVVDFDSLPQDAEWWSVDAVVCALGTTIRQAGSEAAFRKVDYELPLAVAKLTRARNARAFVLTSSVGADAGSRTFYLRVKGEVENAIGRCGFPSFTIVRPSMLGGERAQSRPLERLGMKSMQALAPLIPARWRVVSGEAVATALLACAIRAKPGTTVVESEAIPRYE